MSSTAASRSSPRDPPAGLVVRLDENVLVEDGGRLLCGGVPYRLTRLTAAGAACVDGWRAGAPVGDGAGRRALARKLLDAGVLLTAPEPRAAREGEVVAVVPTRDRASDLARCLEAVARHSPAVAQLVVDDGSDDPDEIRAVADRFEARVVRVSPGRGPAHARNVGISATTEPIIAFVDSDVVVRDGWLERLLAHLDDPGTGIVAPRVMALHDGPGVVARYEAACSSLDMGPFPGTVGVGQEVGYLPSATMLVRREAIPGGFDEELFIGEDVDFVWRATASGWRAQYDPSASVLHDHRVRLRAVVRRRFVYAFSIGLLARRHPGALPPLRTDGPTAAVLALLILGRPKLASLIVMARVVRLRRALLGLTSRPTTLATRLTRQAALGTLGGLSHAVRRAWSPVLILAAIRSRSIARVVALLWVAQGLDPRSRPLRHLPLAVADDILAAVATIAACLHQRTIRPLLPSITVAFHRSSAPAATSPTER